ncbi:3'-5' exonuclease [Paracoccus jiaweipingae]|uniref:3'-5' exonuclease n=1 Tax=Paracoccus sp. p2-l61 TaxID=3366950 RepID=UPI0037A18712
MCSPDGSTAHDAGGWKRSRADADTVTLMTIHGARGKEFDHVYVAGLAKDILPRFQTLKAGANSAEVAEDGRNGFVAITPAPVRPCLSDANSYWGWPR